MVISKRLLALAMVLPVAGIALIAAKAAHIIPVPLQQVIPPHQRQCNARTPSGLGWRELRPGTGPRPAASEKVTVNYIGYLAATGVVFDQDENAQFRVRGVIDGFAEGLQMMPRGAIYRFCIPAAQGYGAEGGGPIPPNADLVFQVELK